MIKAKISLIPDIPSPHNITILYRKTPFIQYSFNRGANFWICLKEFLHMRVKGLSVMSRCIRYRPCIQGYPLSRKTKHTCLISPIHLSSWFYNCSRSLIAQFPRMITPLLIFTTAPLRYPWLRFLLLFATRVFIYYRLKNRIWIIMVCITYQLIFLSYDTCP